MKKHIKALAVVAVIMVVFTMLLLVAEDRRYTQEWTPLHLDPSDAGRGGSKALFLLLGQAGRQPVKVQCDKFKWRGGEELPGGLFFSLPGVAVEKKDLKDITGYVESGGVLLFVPYRQDVLLESLGIKYVFPKAFRSDAKILPCSPLLAPLTRIAVEGKGARLSGVPGSQRLIEDQEGAVLATFPKGQGALYVLADPWVFSNDALDREQNADLALFLLARERPAFLVYSEEAPSIARKLLGNRTVRLMVLALFVLGLLYVLSRNVRNYEVLEPATRKERLQMEFVEAMAGFYRRFGASHIALESAYRRGLNLFTQRGATLQVKKLSEALTFIPHLSEAERNECRSAIAAVEAELASEESPRDAQRSLKLFQDLQLSLEIMRKNMLL
ncbi:MAG: DUF4350 domain-containing protein [Candidatus Eremiobacteraeota bacterium]|nr:DUF4350 domain-containing protein [Candidatus Eremiobacteraeota bacterium]